MFVLDESSKEVLNNSFWSAEEAEVQAARSAKKLGRPINVYELVNGELMFAFRVRPCGKVETEGTNGDLTSSGDQVMTSPFVLGRSDILDHVAEFLERKGHFKLAAEVDAERSKLSATKKPKQRKGIAGIVQQVIRSQRS